MDRSTRFLLSQLVYRTEYLIFMKCLGELVLNALQFVPFHPISFNFLSLVDPSILSFPLLYESGYPWAIR